MIFTSLYTVIDGLFISNFAGADAFAGMNLIAPITMIVGGIGFMFGSGGSALASKLLGEGKNKDADKVFTMMLVFSTIIVIIGAKISRKAPDKEHPFGHERLESIASIFLAMLLGVTALILGYNGVLSIIDFVNGVLPIQTDAIYVALGCAIASILVKFSALANCLTTSEINAR